ncbi:MAG: type II secretion system F family protein [Candidatus Pacebacteria bacterium]|nr:type II secretion system F family protein [Candidatus Paceibacterota bacterium]
MNKEISHVEDALKQHIGSVGRSISRVFRKKKEMKSPKHLDSVHRSKPARSVVGEKKAPSKEEQKSIFKRVSERVRFGHFSMKDKIHFSKRLSFLIHGGVPIVESLLIIQKQNRSKGRAIFFETIIADVSSGQYLSTSLERFKNLFGAFAVNMIRVGETSGILDQNLEYLSHELEKKHALKQRIVGALIYPIFVTIATLGLTLLLTAFIFPKILPIFTSLHIAIPLTTRILISVSSFLHLYGWSFLLFIFLLSATVIFLVKRFERIRFWLDVFLLKIPFVKKIVQSYNMANMSRTLGLLLKGGVTVSEAILLTGESTNNLVFQKELSNLTESVMKGERISTYFNKNEKLFPDTLSHMVAVGETTGNLSNTFLYIADMFEREVDDITRNLASSVEPVLMIIMGLLVGLVAVSVITPIYEITAHLRR